MDKSPWPLLASVSAFFFTSGLVFYMHRIRFSFFIFFLGLMLIFLTMYVWWRDIIRESTFQGYHSLVVQKGLKIGFSLFIISEIMFFFGFFWAFFHSGLTPVFNQAYLWPALGVIPFNPYSIPLCNTCILLVSGGGITWVHYSLIFSQSKLNSFLAFFFTIFLAFIFTIFQIFEYFTAPISISDSVFGSSFFSLTGLHGLHVLIGTIFIFTCLVRFYQNHFTEKHHLGLEFAAWYWHFVDVIWLFLFVFVYCWCWL